MARTTTAAILLMTMLFIGLLPTAAQEATPEAELCDSSDIAMELVGMVFLAHTAAEDVDQLLDMLEVGIGNLRKRCDPALADTGDRIVRSSEVAGDIVNPVRLDAGQWRMTYMGDPLQAVMFMNTLGNCPEETYYIPPQATPTDGGGYFEFTIEGQCTISSVVVTGQHEPWTVTFEKVG